MHPFHLMVFDSVCFTVYRIFIDDLMASTGSYSIVLRKHSFVSSFTRSRRESCCTTKDTCINWQEQIIPEYKHKCAANEQWRKLF